MIRNREERGKRKREKEKKEKEGSVYRGAAGKGQGRGRLRSQHSDGLIAKWRSRSAHDVQYTRGTKAIVSPTRVFYSNTILYYNKDHVPLITSGFVQPLLLFLRGT